MVLGVVWTMGLQLLIVGSLKSCCDYWCPYFLSDCGSNATLASQLPEWPRLHLARNTTAREPPPDRRRTNRSRVSPCRSPAQVLSRAVDGLLLLLALTPVLLGYF